MAELVELEGGDHNSLRSSHPEVEQLTVDFFSNHLRAGDGQGDLP